jgi:hypothetical protein
MSYPSAEAGVGKSGVSSNSIRMLRNTFGNADITKHSDQITEYLEPVREQKKLQIATGCGIRMTGLPSPNCVRP